ncbi:hypothetical protein [uncultured Bacteroides sp.]|uniref:hypothetical protein n=1 Tax=uncultured Bacteroides sp. TaxID=162156 RepID=UPI002626A36A|nr:hypothetical protein [uncultured Bacteroides sp.]
MKKLNQYALLSAMMLTGAVGFTACSSDNDPAGDVNIGNGEVVKTQFAINIPYAGKGNTRMSDDIVQGQDFVVFRGMQNIRLMPFNVGGTDVIGVPESNNENRLVNGRTIILANIETGELQSDANYKVYSDVGIPLGTDAFLFYGEALPTIPVTPVVNGQLNTTPNFSDKIEENLKLNAIEFSLQPIVEDGNNSEIDDAQKALAGMLTAIANVSTEEETTKKKWKDAENGNLKNLYIRFTALKAGSANSIRLTVQDLYNQVNELTFEDSSNDGKIKSALIKKIKEYFNPSSETDSPVTLTYNEDNPSVTTYKEYPTDKGLPCGSVRVQWGSNSDNDYKFSYASTVADQAEDNDNPLNVAGLNTYTYPSSLFYMANTSIKTSNTTLAEQYPNKNWGTVNDNTENTILGLYANGNKITNTTQSVALVNPINYAVGRFDVKAKFASATVKDAQNDNITIGDGFPFTGVLIGGQKNVDWNFLPKTEKDSKEFTIFDKAIAESTKIGTADNNTILNKTLVLASGNEVVYFALELTNNSDKQFEGVDGIVHAGATFYLIGKLEPDTEVGENKHTSVFEKDHFTTATVTISSLKNAYNCVPDLRTPKLELGLSVDLKWQEGLSQDVTID